MLKKVLEFIFVRVLRARWIVGTTANENQGEMGLRIMGVNLWYYKWSEPMIVPNSNEYGWKVARKREFGETVKSSYGPNDTGLNFIGG